MTSCPRCLSARSLFVTASIKTRRRPLPQRAYSAAVAGKFKSGHYQSLQSSARRSAEPLAMIGEIDRGADRTGQRDCRIDHDERNRARPLRLLVPEQHQVVGDVERIDDRKRQHPRSQSPDAVGVDQEYDAEERTQHEVVRDAVELVTEDYQPAYRWIVG